MSYESWAKEFYPVEASEVPVEQAAAHSLQKWIGLREENLEKHDVVLKNRSVVEIDANDRSVVHKILAITSDSCALCHHFIEEMDRLGCVKCPLAQHLKLEFPDCTRCDNHKRPYSYWFDTRDPEPMIAALQAVVDKQHVE